MIITNDWPESSGNLTITVRLLKRNKTYFIWYNLTSSTWDRFKMQPLVLPFTINIWGRFCLYSLLCLFLWVACNGQTELLISCIRAHSVWNDYELPYKRFLAIWKERLPEGNGTFSSLHWKVKGAITSSTFYGIPVVDVISALLRNDFTEVVSSHLCHQL